MRLRSRSRHFCMGSRSPRLKLVIGVDSISRKTNNNNNMNGSTSDAKSRVSSPISNSPSTPTQPSTNLPTNSSSSNAPMSATERDWRRWLCVWMILAGEVSRFDEAGLGGGGGAGFAGDGFESVVGLSGRGKNQEEVINLEELQVFFSRDSDFSSIRETESDTTNRPDKDNRTIENYTTNQSDDHQRLQIDELTTPNAENNSLHDSTMSLNNTIQPLGQSSPDTPLEVLTNPYSTIVDDVIFRISIA
ncbi:hypothetical protein LWI28_012734 [Acer negundo]|uniref:Uncharacterized protein n=1 Tax=Acer negundo TaxID=4023 RepID=A0AAD5IYW8_ACENE|nr:hypothetical protein LWI28_012734 [Acer negundo]